MKKLLSLFLIAVMLFSMFPATGVNAQAVASTTAELSNDEFTVSGTNSVGNLLSNEIQQVQQENAVKDSQYRNGYSIDDIVIEGNIATVTYSSLEEANLIVALYSEDGMQFLTSGDMVVSADENTATVTIAGTMPRYFMAQAYLVDVYDFSPLCPAYNTPMYTQKMQELLASTIEDYDQEKVLNLDDRTDTNFAVYSDSVVVIDGGDGINTVVSVDYKSNTYIIENADEQVSTLTPGTIIAYPWAEGEVLIVKVSTISVDGTTVTIIGTEMEIEEVFAYMKMEAMGDASDVIVDDSTVDDGITFDGLTQGETQPQGSHRFEGEGNIKNSLNYTADKKIKAKHDEVEVTISLKGTIGLELDIDFAYYISMTTQFMKFETDVGTKLAVSLSGKVDIEIPLGDFSVMFFGVSIGFEPAIKLEVEGKVEFSCFVGFGIGYIYDNFIGLRYRDTVPMVEFDGKVEVTVFLGIDMNPKIDILKGVVAKAELEAPIGIELKAKPAGTIAGDSADAGETIHGCKTCVDMTVSFVLELSAKIEFLKCENMTFKTKAKFIEAELWKMYWSLDHGDFGIGECPYIKHRITIQVKDSKGKLVPGAKISANINGDDLVTELGTTNANGNLTVYLPANNYSLSTVVAGKKIGQNRMIEEPCKVVLDMSSLNANSNTIFDRIDAEQIVDRGTVSDSGECGDHRDNVIWKFYDNGTLVISGRGAIRDYAWNEDKPWSVYADEIHSVVVAKGVTEIGNYSFEGFGSLTSATIADGVTRIGEEAFNFTSLTNVTIPDSVTIIENRAFYSCDITSLKLPSQLLYIGSYAFAFCHSLDSVTIPENVISIGQYAFACCQGLREVTILGNINAIESAVFRECESLHSVNLPNSITSIGYCAFYQCNSLKNINMPTNLISIDDFAFSGCSLATQFAIPANVSSIGKSAFSDCNLESVNIGAKVVSIGEKAFAGNSQLNGIWVDVNNPAYCNDEKGALYSKDKTVLITVPSTLSGAYSIGANVKKIEEYAFWITEEMTGIWVDDNNPAYSSDEYGVLFDKNKTVLIRAPGKLSGNYTIPGSVLSIEAFAFRDCSDITSVTIPDSVTSMGRSTFYECFDLEFVSIGNGITAIPEATFYFCGLKSVAIPDSVTSIGDYAFYFSGLKSVTIPDSVTSIGDCAFMYCFSLATVSIGTGVTSIGGSAFNFFLHYSVKDVYYKGTEEQWNEIAIEMGNDELLLANFHYQSTAPEDIVYANATDELPMTRKEAKKIASQETKGNFVHQGQYGEETIGNKTVKTASFSNLVSNAEYVLLVLKDTEREDVLTADNLLYISQTTAEEDGTLTFSYVPREAAEVSYVMALGASDKNLNDAVVTFPDMYVDEDIQAVNPTVVYKGQTLTEGLDYIIVGAVAFEDVGTYTCYIRGIHNYTGLVSCAYTVFNRPIISGWNLTLGEKIAINFYIPFDEEVVDMAMVDITLAGETTNLSVNNAQMDESSGQYVFTIELASAQMTETVVVTIRNGEKIIDERRYSIRQYADYILDDANGFDNSVKSLVKEMLNYGAMSQVYFDYNVENLANTGIVGMAAASVPETTADVIVQDKISGLDFYGASLVYRDRIAVRYYFTGDVTGLTFTASGKNYAPVVKDGMYCVEITGILPQNLDQQITLIVKDASGNLLSVTYGPMNYIVRMSQTDDENTKGLMTALYNYHLAARQYYTDFVGVYYWDVVLLNQLRAYFYLNIDQAVAHKTQLRIILGDNTEVFTVADLETTEDELYIAPVNVAAAQMTEDIVLQFLINDSVILSETYTIRQYCDMILEDDYSSRYHALVKEMLNYGATAQLYFDYNTERLANAGIDGLSEQSIPETVEEASVIDDIKNLNFYGACLVYGDQIAVRYYFSGDVSGCTFNADGRTYIPIVRNGMYYIEVDDILPQNLDRQITLTVTDADGKNLIVTYGPMNYIVRMNQKDNGDIHELLRALYNYHLAAKALSNGGPDRTEDPDIVKQEYEFTIEPVTYLQAYWSSDGENWRSILAYEDGDDSFYVEWNKNGTKRGSLSGKAANAITYYLEQSGFLEMNGQSVSTDGAACACIYADYGEGDRLSAEYYGTIPQEYIEAYDVLEECFEKMTVNMPEYSMILYEVGSVSEHDRETIFDIIAQQGDSLYNSFTMYNIPTDNIENFCSETGLSAVDGVETAASFEHWDLPIPYYLVIVTLADENKANNVAQDFEDNIDWNRCGVIMPSNAAIAVKGDQVLCLMGSGNRYIQSYQAIIGTGWEIVKTLENPDLAE